MSDTKELINQNDMIVVLNEMAKGIVDTNNKFTPIIGMLSSLITTQQTLQEEQQKTIENVATLESKTNILGERINNLDCTNIEGTPRQRLSKMLKKYALTNGIPYEKAWHEFVSSFNYAFHTNIMLRLNNYKKEKGLKNLNRPDYLERIGMIEDALRVADKMLNQGKAI